MKTRCLSVEAHSPVCFNERIKKMWDSYEESVIEFEEARNKAMDSYFNARLYISRTVLTESIFEAGFRMAWNLDKEESKE